MTETQQTKIDGDKIRDRLFSPETPDYAFFTEEEVCAAFSGCAKRTLRDWRKDGFPEPIKYPGMMGWPLSALKEFLKVKAQEGFKLAREMAK